MAAVFDFIAAQKLKDSAELILARRAAKQKAIEAGARLAAVPPRYVGASFDTYEVPTPASRAARDRCASFAENFKTVMECGANLLLLGNVGTGKTHLSCAIISHVVADGFTALFCTEGDLLSRIRATYDRDAEQREEDAIESFRRPDLLVLDEVGIGIGNHATKVAMLNRIVNNRYNHRRPVIILSNLSEPQLRKYLGFQLWDRLTDFSSGSNVIQMSWPSWRQNGHARASA